MTVSAAARRVDAGTLLLGAALLAVTAWSWAEVLRHSRQMSSMTGMGGMTDMPTFVFQWGVMMAAMMLPSAAPAILLYRTVRGRLAGQGERAVPASVFALVYILLWTLIGVPVYGGYVAASLLAASWSRFTPYAVAAVLAAAGIYQLTGAKRRCLAACESPLSFFMSRWRSGYAATLDLAVRHSAYCIGCCWALMVVLVAAGAMGIWWVTAIAVVVFLEKCLPKGRLTALFTGVALIVMAAVVIVRPSLAVLFRS